MGYSQGLETIVAMWKQIRHHEDLRLMLVGDGQAKPMLEAELGDDDKVDILPTQPRADLPGAPRGERCRSRPAPTRDGWDQPALQNFWDSRQLEDPNGREPRRR